MNPSLIKIHTNTTSFRYNLAPTLRYTRPPPSPPTSIFTALPSHITQPSPPFPSQGGLRDRLDEYLRLRGVGERERERDLDRDTES